ncbi:hypothetical protein [Mesobacillus zeae]|nr:hypothetical protein [Mesobacillus zeae]
MMKHAKIAFLIMAVLLCSGWIDSTVFAENEASYITVKGNAASIGK